MRTLDACWLLGCLVWAAPGIEEQAHGRAVTARLRIEPTYRAAPGQCLELGPEDLRIRLRGRPIDDLERVDLARDPAPSVHALLLDTSHSMGGKLGLAREAAASYVRQLRPEHERALVMSFDETVQLQHGLSRDREALAQAIERISMGLMTSVHDGLVLALRELRAHDSRAVVVLLTDGADSGSLFDEDDVFDQLESMPDVTVFAIGLGVPPMDRGGRTPKTFLQRLAGKTRGRYFDAPTTSRLPRIYTRIRETLDSEAILTVVDPEPEAAPGRLAVASKRPGCRVVQLDREAEDAASPETVAGDTRLPRRWVSDAGFDLVASYSFHGRHPVAGRCLEYPEVAGADDDADSLPRWIIEVDERKVSGCAVDLTTDLGLLFDPWGDEWLKSSNWPWSKMRAIELPLPPIDELPRDVVDWMDHLADRGLVDPAADGEHDPRLHPLSRHARPFHGHPALVQGRTFFDLRDGLARALYAREDYRAWARARLTNEAQARLRVLERRLHRRAPGRSDDQIAAAVRASREGRRILERSVRPGIVELQRFLGAWHGDVSAHDLFTGWERTRLERLLAGEDGTGPRRAFHDEWRELRRMFHVPSHTRVVAVLAPVRGDDSIGYYRIVLPRGGLLRRRLKGYRRPAELANTPLDLLPDLPLGHWLVTRLIDEDPALPEALRGSGIHPERPRYELLGKSGSHRPGVAFRDTRITVVLRSTETRAETRLVARVRLERERGDRDGPRQPYLVSMEVDGSGPSELRDRLEHAAASAVRRDATARE